MTRLVNKLEQVLENIQTFQTELENDGGDNELTRTLGHFRAWYAMETAGGWRFAPSKFVGYKDLTASSYGKTYRSLSGRDTEKVLGRWFNQVSPESPLGEHLHEQLQDLLSQHGKSPKAGTRISVLHSADVPRPTSEEQKLADALAVLYQSLPEGAKMAFKNLV